MASISNEKQTPTLIEVDLASPNYRFSEVFDQIAKDIPAAVKQAHEILDPININADELGSIDEEPIIQATRDLKNVKAYGKKFDEMISVIKKSYNAARNQQVAAFGQRFRELGSAELSELIDKGDGLNRLIKEQRTSSRWDELQEKFESTLALYPLLEEYIPRRTKFVQFKEQNPKLVSAAKNKPVTQVMLDAVTTYVGDMQEDVQTILGLQSIFQEELFKQYQTYPDIHRIIGLNNELVRKRELEEKRAQEKRDAEIKRQAEELAKKMAQEQEEKRKALEAEAIKKAEAEAKKEGTQAKVIIKTVPSASSTLNVSKESRANAGSPFAETLESYLKKAYPDLSTDALRFNAIFATIQKIGKQDPEIMRFIKSPTHGLDAIKLLLER